MSFLVNVAISLLGSKKQKVDNEIAKIVAQNTSCPQIHTILAELGTPVAIQKFSEGWHSSRLVAIYAITHACTNMNERSIIIRPYHPNMTFSDDDERKTYFALFMVYGYCVRVLRDDFDRVSKYFAISDATPFLSSLERFPRPAGSKKEASERHDSRPKEVGPVSKERRRFEVGFQHLVGVIVGAILTNALIHAVFGSVPEFAIIAVWLLWVHLLIFLIYVEQNQNRNNIAPTMKQYEEGRKRDTLWVTFIFGGWIGFCLLIVLIGMYKTSMGAFLLGLIGIALPLLGIVAYRKGDELMRLNERIHAFLKTKAGERVTLILFVPVMLLILHSLFR